MARSLGAIGLAGFVLSVIWLLLPHPRQSNVGVLLALALVGGVLSLALLSGRLDRRRRPFFEVMVAIGTTLVSLGNYYAHVRGTGLPFLYIWCTTYAFWFFSRRGALIQVALVVLGYGAASVAASDAHPGLAGSVGFDWGPLVLLTGTVLITGELVRRLGAMIAEGQARFTSAFEQAPTPMARLVRDGLYTDANAAFCALVGRERSQIVGSHWSTLAAPEQLSALREHWASLFSGRSRADQFESDYVKPDGSRVTVVATHSLLGAPGDSDAELFVQALDVTERRAAAEALRLSEARLRALIDNAPAVIAIRDTDGRLVVVNREGARLLNSTPEELVGRGYEEMFPPEQAEVMRLEDARAVESGEPTFSEQTIELRDGGHTFLTVTFPLPTPRGESATVCRISFDVTDRERARLALVRSNEARRRLLAELVRAQEDERRRIAADVHDESIQVLAGVAIRLGLLGGTLERPEQQRLIEGLDESVRRGINSLRQLLFNLRLPALDELGLAAALRSYLSETIVREGTTYSLEDRLAVEPSPELRTVLYRVAQEALSNVRKHARATHVEVRLTGSSDGFAVAVSDDGVGFDAERLPDEVPGHLGIVGMRERVQAAGGGWRSRASPVMAPRSSSACPPIARRRCRRASPVEPEEPRAPRSRAGRRR